MPNSIHIILDGKAVTASSSSSEPATRADSTSPNTPWNTTKSDFTDQSSSKKHGSSSGKDPDSLVLVLIITFLMTLSSGLAIISNQNGRNQGTQELTAQFPDGKIFSGIESLWKKEESLKHTPETLTVYSHCGKCNSMFKVRHYILRERKKELAEKVEALDKEELEHLRKRAMVLEGKLETQKKSSETDMVRESPREAVNAWIVQDKTHTETVEALQFEQASILFPGTSLGIEDGPCVCPNCSGGKANPAMQQAEKSPSANVIPQVHNCGLEVNETLRTGRHQDDPIAHTKPDTKTTRPPRTKRGPKAKAGPSPASTVVLESLSADTDATKEEIGQIKRAKEALKCRERELEAQAKDRKKRIQELNAPKSDQTWPIARGMVLGSALAFGFTMIIQK